MTIVLVSILPHIIIEVAVFGLLPLIAFWGLAYTWWHRRGELEWETLPSWRRIVANIGLLAFTVQAVLFILSWTRIGRDYTLFGRWAGWVLPTFLVAVPCVLAGNGKSRWWLLSSSVLLFVICFFIVLSA
jgi:hypothetical protein